MKPLYASIDIGTQSVLLLIASLEDEENSSDTHLVQNKILVPKLQKMANPRLGKGLVAGGQIDEGSSESLMAALLDFRQCIHRLGARLTAVVATEALRKAENSAVLVKKISAFMNHPCRIITGEEESRYSQKAVRHRYPDSKKWIVDIGGGSTEIAEEKKHRSLPIGAVQLFETHGAYPDPGNRKFSKAFFKEHQSKLKQAPEIICVGGTASTLGMMEKGITDLDLDRIEGMQADKNQIARHIQRLADLAPELRSQVPGLDAYRADIIVPGLCILEALMERVGAESVTLSQYGLRYGVILDALEKSCKLIPSTVESKAA